MSEKLYKKVNPSAKKLWIVNGVISSIVIMIIAFIVYLFAKKYINYWSLIIGGIISFLDIFVHPFIEYKQWRYCITEDRIEFTHGIYFKTKTIIPISRIQHLDISQGPIQKIFKLSTLEIYTAGASHEIEAIATEEAENIVENLNKIVLRVDGYGESK